MLAPSNACIVSGASGVKVPPAVLRDPQFSCRSCGKVLSMVHERKVLSYRVKSRIEPTGSTYRRPIVRRIVRNKAAEKAKHAHQQQQAQQQQGQQQGQPGSGGSVSVIAHAPATPAGHPAAAAPNAYSISGILGIPAHHQDPNGNSIKRKRADDASMTLLQRRNYPILRVALPFNLLSLRIYLNGISESS
ncbi:hypothetical protein HZH68_000307 [Vespula germanica]|uniref:Uncharacterized protein n=1 Tax=Vespula germanica TaxID=30212 RepID=A0A834NTV5_VESGE|nr:hypothetical protein HZH68_000307 [Vespula germanica]